MTITISFWIAFGLLSASIAFLAFTVRKLQKQNNILFIENKYMLEICEMLLNESPSATEKRLLADVKKIERALEESLASKDEAPLN